ncbi:5-oxoprolinase subunit PxpA [Spongiivirga sp. MCCC 1A20706]|uniref:5-oxoprolinase subunit PxpA n=1 Tax=Spongiivirga sp. MCCC 1A20706 TaxID=3160963 RepID=UPI0039772ED6
MNTTVDINCDLGEGFEFDEQLMQLISSCNIACGGHYGDEKSITETIKLAQRYDVKIGAHPSYPDKTNFGRKVLSLGLDELQASLEYQLELFKKVAESLDATIHHIKPHGALYNEGAVNMTVANCLLKAIHNVFSDIPIYTPYNSEISDLAINYNLPVIYEAFADRNYEDDGRLVSRFKENALIYDVDTAVKHVLSILGNELLTHTGKRIKIKADTFCVHGDNPKALELVKGLTKKLNEQGCTIA